MPSGTMTEPTYLHDVRRGSIIFVDDKVEFIHEGMDGMYAKLRTVFPLGPYPTARDKQWWRLPRKGQIINLSAMVPATKISTPKKVLGFEVPGGIESWKLPTISITKGDDSIILFENGKS